MSVKDLFPIDLSSIDFNDPDGVKDIFTHLSNLVEALYQENLALKAENQKLKDEINRSKGEKGKPDIKPKSSPKRNKSDKKRKRKNR